MNEQLNETQHASADPPDGEDLVIVQRPPTGRRGRRRIEIDPHILRYAMELRPNTALAEVFGCSSRTVRRRALEYWPVDPSPPVRTDNMQENGTQSTAYTPHTPATTTISDEELDRIMGEILETFPSFGRQMITAQFRLYGYRVPRQRIRDSYVRIMGPPPEFGGRRVERRVYKVAGPNALCHHDGWHGMFL